MKVRTGKTYIYDPVMIDRCSPPYGEPKPGDHLRVVKLHGCPPPNTMNHCHVVFADSGVFAGLVCCNSLVSP